MRVVISASVAGSNRSKDAAGGKVASLLSSKGEESHCALGESVTSDEGTRLCWWRRMRRSRQWVCEE